MRRSAAVLEPEYESEGCVEIAQLARAETADGLAEHVWTHRGRLLDEDARRRSLEVDPRSERPGRCGSRGRRDEDGREGVPAPALGGGHPPGRTGSYREVLRHRPFVAVIGLNALFILAGFSGFDVLPVYAKNEAGVGETQIGLLFLVNTVVIVLAQAPVARLARGRRRMPTLALLGLVWAGGWLLVPVAGSATGAALWLLGLTMVAFAVGQCLHGAVAAPLVADLAEPRLLGRYMALNALSWQVGFAFGPALGGAGLAVSPAGVWIAAAALCVLGSVLALTVVEKRLPSAVRRTPLPTPA